MCCIDNTLLLPTICGAYLSSCSLNLEARGELGACHLASGGARLAFIAQSVLSAVVLPFAILHTVLHGFYAIRSEDSWTTVLTNIARVLGHATLIPLGILFSALPQQTIQDQGTRFRDSIDRLPDLINNLAPQWANAPEVIALTGRVREVFPPRNH